ncbi:MAG TPA: hypothetical protein VG295_04480 [Solirubrobacteraceae bacterium]|nr:hypothetical protein [Solirubrobacteraceae bacterium]
MTRALLSVAAVAVTAALLGCGASHPPPRASGTTRVALPGLGALSYRCAGRRRIEATFSTQGASASESATVEGDGARHLRAATLNEPGAGGLTAPTGTYRTLTWRVIQSTEPRTVEATIRLTFTWQADGYCGHARTNSDVKVIGHQGGWKAPDPWP